MMRERRFGDDGVGARSPRRERNWDRSECREEDGRRYLQLQRFSESSEANRFRASGSADRIEYDRRRDGGDRDGDGDGRLWSQQQSAQFIDRNSPKLQWNQLSSAQFIDRNSPKLQWNQLVEKKPSNGITPNSNLNSGYAKPGLSSGYYTLHLNPNDLSTSAYVNSNPDSRVLHVGPGYAEDTHGIRNNVDGYAEDTHGIRNNVDGYAADTHGIRNNVDGYAADTHGIRNNVDGYAADTHGIGNNIEQSYQRSHYPDMTGLPKHLSMDNGRTRTYQTDRGGIKNYNSVDSTLGNSSMGLQNYNEERPLQFGDRSLHMEKPRYYSGHPSPYGTPISNSTKSYGVHEGSPFVLLDGIRRSSGIRTETIDHDGYGQSLDGIRRSSGILTETIDHDGYGRSLDGIRRSSGILTETIDHDGYGRSLDGIRRSSGILTETIDHDGYGQSLDFPSSLNSELHLGRLNQQRALLSPVKDMDRAYAYPEMQTERSYAGTLSNGIPYNEMISGREDCESQEFQKPRDVDPIADIMYETGIHLRDGSRESMRLHRHIALQEQEQIDRNIGSYTMEQDGEIMGSRSTSTRYQSETHIDNESLREDNNFRRDSDALVYDDRMLISADDQDLYETGGIPNQMLMPEEIGMQGMSKKMRSRKHAKSKKARMLEQNIKHHHNWGASNNIFHGRGYVDEQWADEISGQAYSDDDISSSSLDAPTSMQDPSSRSRSTGRDVKNRLGPHGRDIKKRLGPASRDIKKRLGPVGRDTKKHIGPAGELSEKRPSRNAHIQLNCHRKSMQCDGSDTLPVADSSKVEGKHRNNHPSEDSEEFKLSVHVTFLKFVKLLNENSAHRRRYTEQGGTGIMKCSICGSKSKEFVDTKSLAEHALMSRMAGSRAEHMGFHKALCALMGWNSSIPANDSHWTPKLITDAEAMALKEDLIIWPPTIIIHNSSIANKIPAERMIISIEDLEAILKGNGFDREKTKVCRGKPANQSIVVVSFPGTLSGLKEAERLHKFYAENKHGRAELQVKFTGNDTNSCGEETKGEKSPKERVENVLFGYLGVAGDLDKLDFETKKRCVVKSKKDIQVMAGASFN